MYINSAPARGRPAVRRAAVRALEPDAVRAHRAALRHLATQRAEHLQSRQRRRQRHVPTLEGFQGQG